MKCQFHQLSNKINYHTAKPKINRFNSNNKILQKQMKKGQFIFFPAKIREKIIKNIVQVETS